MSFNDSINFSEKKPKSYGSSYKAPTVQEILQDPITKLSLKYWSSGSTNKKPFSANIIEKIYKTEIAPEKNDNSRTMLLELSLYLEKYVKID